MPVEVSTRNEQLASERIPAPVELEPVDRLRALAIEQIHRVRRFKLRH